MSAKLIVSYDGTANDDDALALGKLLEAPAGRLALSGSVRTTLDGSRGSVLVVPSGKPLRL